MVELHPDLRRKLKENAERCSWTPGGYFYPRRWEVKLRPQDVGLNILVSLHNSVNWTELRWSGGTWRYHDGTTVEDIAPEWWMPMPDPPPRWREG